MKTLILILLAVVLMGCATPPSNTNTNSNVNSNSNHSADLKEYRDGMKDGAIVSTVVVGKVLCNSFKATQNECERIQSNMAHLTSVSIDKVSNSTIAELRAKDASYRAALKSGSAAFAVTVGDVLCSTTATSKDKCTELQTAMAKTTNSFIDMLTDEELEKLKNGANPNEISV